MIATVFRSDHYEENEWYFRPKNLHCKAILGREQPGLRRWILLGILPLVQDWPLKLLTALLCLPFMMKEISPYYNRTQSHQEPPMGLQGACAGTCNYNVHTHKQITMFNRYRKQHVISQWAKFPTSQTYVSTPYDLQSFIETDLTLDALAIQCINALGLSNKKLLSYHNTQVRENC